MKIAVEALKEKLAYDPTTGEIFWKKKHKGIRSLQAGYTSKQGYRLIHINYALIFAHRIAWALYYGEWPSQRLDHINGDKLDNRICNLREVTTRQNAQNQQIHRDGKLVGAIWNKKSKKWQACLAIDGHNKSLGYFSTEEEAHNAYISACSDIEKGELPQSERERRGHLSGAYYDKSRGRWFSMIYVGGHNKHLGIFSSKEEAHAAYIEAKYERDRSRNET